MASAAKGFPADLDSARLFLCLRNTGLWQAMNQLLVAGARKLEGRDATPSAGVIEC